jgi:ParB family chromosome partitioning protein
VRKALAEGNISEGHARALLGLSNAEAQNAALAVVVNKEMNVRQTEELVRKLNGIRTKKQAPKEPAPEVKALEEKLRSQLGTKVNLKKTKKGGSLVIYFYSDEELQTLLDQLLKEE